MKKLVLVLVITIHYINATAQIGEIPPCTFSNPNLIQELKDGVVREGIVLWGQSSYGVMASSTLKPTDQNPFDKTDTTKYQTEEDKSIAEIENQNAREEWACQYSAYSLSDGKPSTAWAEGVDGDGIGEVVLVGYTDITKPVKIWTGYGKSDALFNANNRPAKVKVYLLGTNCSLASQSNVHYKSLKVAGVKEVMLQDMNAYQPLSLPAIQHPVNAEPCEYDDGTEIFYFLAIEILSVYKGTRYHDTCISEIRNQ